METLLEASSGWMLWQYLLAAGASALVVGIFANLASEQIFWHDYEKQYPGSRGPRRRQYPPPEEPVRAPFVKSDRLRTTQKVAGAGLALALALIPIGGVAFLLELFSAIDTAGGGGAVEWYQVVGVAMMATGALLIPVKIYHNRGLAGTRPTKTHHIKDHQKNPVVAETVLLVAGLVISFDALLLVAGALEWYQILGVLFLLGGTGGLVFGRDHLRGGASSLGGFIWIGVALLFAAEIVALTKGLIVDLPLFWKIVVGMTIFYFSIGVGWLAGLGTEAGMDYRGSRASALAGPVVALALSPAVILLAILPIAGFVTLLVTI